MACRGCSPSILSICTKMHPVAVTEAGAEAGGVTVHLLLPWIVHAIQWSTYRLSFWLLAPP